MKTATDSVSHMVERAELQKKARTIDAFRKQLDDLHARITQVQAIVDEHEVTTSILSHLYESSQKGTTSARLSIGSGVTLKYVHDKHHEGTALVDLGSGVFGEKPLEEANRITQERMDGIRLLHKDLTEQSHTLEEKITTLAQEFNDAAQQLQSAQNPPADSLQSPPPPTPVADEEKKTPTRPQRRSGRFGSELTLDD